jgi:hypothetical protein
VILQGLVPPKALIGIAPKEKKLSVGRPKRSQPFPCESPACRSLRLLLQKSEKWERMEGHEEKIAQGDYQFLRPSARDLIRPERKKIGPIGNGMRERRPNA